MSFVAHVHLLTGGLLRRRHSGVHGSRKSTVGSLHSGVGIPAPKSQPVPTKEGRNGFKLNPDEKCAAAQLKVQRLEAALAAFGDERSPEKEAIEGFLIQARIPRFDLWRSG